MDQQSPLRIGIVGCGNQGKALAQAVTRIAAMQLVACADPIASAADGAAAFAPGATTHESIEALLGESDVDAVLIATPHHVLQPIALAAVQAGKHVMAEKPIALNEQQAAEIECAAAQKGVRFMPGYSFRFSFGKQVRDLLDAGLAGEVHIITGSIGLPPMNDGWAASPKTGGGPLLFVGSHLVDMALWCVGDESVEVRGDVCRRGDTGADDTSAFQIRFARGAVAQLMVTQSTPTFFFAIDVIGNAGRIWLRGWTFLNFEIEVVSNALSAYKEPTLIHPRNWRDNISAMFVPELEEFAKAIREQRQPSITATDGRRVLRVLDAVVKSAESGKTVALDKQI